MYNVWFRWYEIMFTDWLKHVVRTFSRKFSLEIMHDVHKSWASTAFVVSNSSWAPLLRCTRKALPTCMKWWLTGTELQTLERFLFDLQLITHSQTCLTPSYGPIKLHWQLWLVHFRAGRSWIYAVSRNPHRSKLTSSLSASIFVFTWNESCTVSWPYSVCWADTSHTVLLHCIVLVLIKFSFSLSYMPWVHPSHVYGRWCVINYVGKGKGAVKSGEEIEQCSRK